MGLLIRELIDARLEKLSSKTHRYKLADTGGMFRQSDTRGRDHNRYLYGNK